MITKGDAGNQITKNKLVNAKINPVVKTIFVPNFFNKKPITKFVDASAIKCIENARDVIATAMDVTVGKKLI
ncbi:hypothetical protein JN533_04020 [Staphylococcus aureus]|nr:hypothetical protein JN533_04020 [Staphylococcus aureus]KKI67683.1 hypothetical protein UF67_1894 [Staphylococcus aureus]BCQ14925.1 hypothetical protein N1195TP_09360 [Staphylococcus aureus]CAQ49439.1 hypothetical protein SAPIG1012 [Staphylococcus aureus subsp. aureus ST398]